MFLLSSNTVLLLVSLTFYLELVLNLLYTGSLSRQCIDRGLLCFAFNRPPKSHYSIKRDDLYIVGIQRKRVIRHYSTAYFRCYLAVTVVALDLIFWSQSSATFVAHIPFSILHIRSNWLG